MTDIFVAANPVNPNDTSKAGGDQPYWRKNAADVPQGRLTAIVGPRGGRTEFYWSSVSDGGLDGARELPVIGAIEDMNGRTDFRFSSPDFDDGRFLGFQHAEAWGTSGIVKVTQFSTDRRRMGAIEYEATHTETGTLYRLSVHLDRTDAQQVALDPVAPFFNAVYRTCTFEFENDSTESDPSSFIQECADFDGTEGPRSLTDIVLGHRSAKALRPRQERRRGNSDAARTANAGGFDIGDAVIVDNPVDAEPSPVFLTDNRMRVTEFDWDDISGVLLEERAFKDVTTTEDTTVSTYTYHPWDESLAVRRLHTRKTRDVGSTTVAASPSVNGRARTRQRGASAVIAVPQNAIETRRSFEYPLADYVGTEWGREIQLRPATIANFKSEDDDIPLPDLNRSRTRRFSQGAVISETAWGEKRNVSFVIDHCGLISRRSTALGWEYIERDPICREVRKQTNHGRSELLTYDGFNRPTSQVIDIIGTDGSLQRNGTVRFEYDPGAGLTVPTMVEIKSGAPGTETLAKDYVDEYGRSWKRVVCERKADAADEWTASLEQAYPCSTDPARMATTITLYDALSGQRGLPQRAVRCERRHGRRGRHRHTLRIAARRAAHRRRGHTQPTRSSRPAARADTAGWPPHHSLVRPRTRDEQR